MRERVCWPSPPFTVADSQCVNMADASPGLKRILPITSIATNAVERTYTAITRQQLITRPEVHTSAMRIRTSLRVRGLFLRCEDQTRIATAIIAKARNTVLTEMSMTPFSSPEGMRPISNIQYLCLDRKEGLDEREEPKDGCSIEIETKISSFGHQDHEYSDRCKL